ncbi:MAG: phosphopyruvate hydratase [bacterium]
MRIKKITAREILDSRGKPTVEATVILANGVSGVAGVPSGASEGQHEAWELRDGGPRYGGQGVLKAVKNIETKIDELLRGLESNKQREIDELMIKLDGTPNKKKLGANAILGVSLACARAGANNARQPLYKHLRQTYRLKYKGYDLPLPMFNIMNGGAHAEWAMPIQEIMVLPVGFQKISDQVQVGAEIFRQLGNLLKKKKWEKGLGDEGGWRPSSLKVKRAFEVILQAIKKAGYRPVEEVVLAMDIAASELYHPRRKKYYLKQVGKFRGRGMIKLVKNWTKKYPFISLEDPLAQDDWQNWQKLTKNLGDKIMLVGDDLFTTNPKRLMKGIEQGAANAILIKPDQIGTLSETIDCIKLAQKNKYRVVVSHRSGETTDTFIADLAVAVNADYAKFGSLARGERVCKYNRLMEIERELGK